MEQLLQTLLRIPEAGALAAAVEGGRCPAAVTGLAPVHRAQIAAALAQNNRGGNRGALRSAMEKAQKKEG